MNVLLRADAGQRQGTGHVMRCLTLGEALLDRGHTVTLMGRLDTVSWLVDAINDSGVRYISCAANELDVEQIIGCGFDWVVVDSYSISSELISRLNENTKCLAVVDGDIRDISAKLYLDQNLETGLAGNHELGDRILAGSAYALVRNAVVEQRRLPEAPESRRRLRVVAFMGGTDPSGAIVEVAKSIAAQRLDVELDLVAPKDWTRRAQDSIATLSFARVIESTKNLPAILGRADVIVSAAGTSAWDICTMARPAVIIALVQNQKESIAAISQTRVALAIDATPDGAGRLSEVGPLVELLVNDFELRTELAQRCWDAFDGLGKVRVIELMERICVA